MPSPTNHGWGGVMHSWHRLNITSEDELLNNLCVYSNDGWFLDVTSMSRIVHLCVVISNL